MACRRRSFPVPVTLNRLAAPLSVFCFGICLYCLYFFGPVWSRPVWSVHDLALPRVSTQQGNRTDKVAERQTSVLASTSPEAGEAAAATAAGRPDGCPSERVTPLEVAETATTGRSATSGTIGYLG